MIRKTIYVVGCIGIFGLLSSCTLIREDASISGLQEEFIGMVHPGQYVYVKGISDIDIGAATQVFLNLSEQDA